MSLSAIRIPCDTEALDWARRLARSATGSDQELLRAAAILRASQNVHDAALLDRIRARQLSTAEMAKAEAEDFETITFPVEPRSARRSSALPVLFCVTGLLALLAAGFLMLASTSTSATAAQVEAWRLCR